MSATIVLRRDWLAGALALPLAACGERSRREPTTTADARIASQTVLSDEVLWDLGPSVRTAVIAVSAMADDERYCRVAHRWPETIPRAAGTSEALLALTPSLVIIASFTASETQRLIARAGLRTLVLDAFDGFADYRANVRAIASAVGASEDGERLVAAFDRRLSVLRPPEPPEPPGPRVVSWTEGSVPGAGTTFDDIATAAGYRNTPALDGRRGHLQIGVEQLVAWDPDVIVVPCPETGCDAFAREVGRRPGIRATRAARRGAVVGVPSRALYSTGLGMLDAVEHLRNARPRTSP